MTPMTPVSPRARAAVPARTRFFIYLPLCFAQPDATHEAYGIPSRAHLDSPEASSYGALVESTRTSLYASRTQAHAAGKHILEDQLSGSTPPVPPGLLSSMKRHGGRYSMTERTDTPASAQSTFSAVKESGWTATVRSVRTVVPKPAAAASRAVASTQ